MSRIHSVYNWQFVNCLRLWTYMVTQPSLQAAFQPLVYSGFAYRMLGLPPELYTPLFATARIAGWSAHRLEELSYGGKLIRPRYECVEGTHPYVPMEER